MEKERWQQISSAWVTVRSWPLLQCLPWLCTLYYGAFSWLWFSRICYERVVLLYSTVYLYILAPYSIAVQLCIIQVHVGYHLWGNLWGYPSVLLCRDDPEYYLQCTFWNFVLYPRVSGGKRGYHLCFHRILWICCPGTGVLFYAVSVNLQRL